MSKYKNQHTMAKSLTLDLNLLHLNLLFSTRVNIALQWIFGKLWSNYSCPNWEISSDTQ